MTTKSTTLGKQKSAMYEKCGVKLPWPATGLVQINHQEI